VKTAGVPADARTRRVSNTNLQCYFCTSCNVRWMTHTSQALQLNFPHFRATSQDTAYTFASTGRGSPARQPVRCGDSCGHYVKVRVKCTHTQSDGHGTTFAEDVTNRLQFSPEYSLSALYYTLQLRPWAHVGFSCWLEWRNVHTWSWLDQTKQGRGLLTWNMWRD